MRGQQNVRRTVCVGTDVVHDAAAVDLLTALVDIPSPSGKESAAVAFLVDWMARHGFDATVDDAGNAVGILGTGPRTLIFLGHIDTVSGWVPVRIENGRLFGRGSVDAKGPLAACTVAVARVGPRPGWRWVVIGAVEEETTTSRGAHHVADTWSPPEFCVIAEPSGVQGITLGYRGRMFLRVRLTDTVRHGAVPQPNAPERLVALWSAIQQRVRTANPPQLLHNGAAATEVTGLFHQISARLRTIATDTDGLREWAEMAIDFRLPLTWSPNAWLTELQPLLEKVHAEWWATGMESAYVADKRSPLVRAFIAGIRQEGFRPRLLVKTGTSDMNVVGPVWQCPIVAYGPGDARLDHTPDEHIDLDEYLTGIRVLTHVLHTLAAE